MRCIPRILGAAVLALGLVCTPGLAAAQGTEAATLRRALSEYAHLRASLERVNAEVAELKRSEGSLRNDYRLRDRMADAEALAQKVTAIEGRLRALGWDSSSALSVNRPGAPPPALPQDGSVELEAKAGLFADPTRKTGS